jgi:hypothetical protein
VGAVTSGDRLPSRTFSPAETTLHLVNAESVDFRR